MTDRVCVFCGGEKDQNGVCIDCAKCDDPLCCKPGAIPNSVAVPRWVLERLVRPLSHEGDHGRFGEDMPPDCPTCNALQTARDILTSAAPEVHP